GRLKARLGICAVGVGAGDQSTGSGIDGWIQAAAYATACSGYSRIALERGWNVGGERSDGACRVIPGNFRDGSKRGSADGGVCRTPKGGLIRGVLIEIGSADRDVVRRRGEPVHLQPHGRFCLAVGIVA